MTDFMTETEEEVIARKRVEWFTGMRELIDVLETTDLPIPTYYAFPGFTWFVSSTEMMAKRVKEMGGKREKNVTDYSFEVQRHVGRFRLEVHSARDNVCEAKVVGTEEVEEKTPTQWVTKTVERDVIEWVCPDSILGELS